MTDTKQDLLTKLNPRRFTAMSPRMSAIVGCILGEKFTVPSLAALTVTSDGMVLGMADGDIGFNVFIDRKSELDRNWNNLLDVAGLTEFERKMADGLYTSVFIRGSRL